MVKLKLKTSSPEDVFLLVTAAGIAASRVTVSAVDMIAAIVFVVMIVVAFAVTSVRKN